MGATESENLVTSINVNVFFKEFTFYKNEFYSENGKKELELADNVLWLDDLLFIFQTKERNHENSIKGVDSWFKNKILNQAKRQITNSIKYFNKYENILVKNCRNQLIDVSGANLDNVKKIIIYKVDEQLNEKNKNTKFYESSLSGNIHLFNIEDYYHICKYLVTPYEVD
ncbi:hypothetical protein [Tenacibaculum piscium]|uniref:Uncharacterized protein n=1 Tax=Tenacibaculum piscium TaxID=1458515 RepID=A0A2H1YG71_9FLAO|nr:hypothetical protein [Tenacibaculum piscium]MBE7629583.1 hypothetical protein [Tenacibaculum piscium]MBE7670702.1 hypothetical protein [Tenacibaculum piscium]SOS74504.1 conserved hypothetical protein [Tenacibaculum piscium]